MKISNKRFLKLSEYAICRQEVSSMVHKIQYILNGSSKKEITEKNKEMLDAINLVINEYFNIHVSKINERPNIRPIISAKTVIPKEIKDSIDKLYDKVIKEETSNNCDDLSK